MNWQLVIIKHNNNEYYINIINVVLGLIGSSVLFSINTYQINMRPKINIHWIVREYCIPFQTIAGVVGRSKKAYIKRQDEAGSVI